MVIYTAVTWSVLLARYQGPDSIWCLHWGKVQKKIKGKLFWTGRFPVLVPRRVQCHLDPAVWVEGRQCPTDRGRAMGSLYTCPPYISQ